MHLSPIVAILDYLDDQHLVPGAYVQAAGSQYEAVVEALLPGGRDRVIGRFDTCDAALKALMRRRRQEWALAGWSVSGHTPN
jgi:hypothetical protein